MNDLDVRIIGKRIGQHLDQAVVDLKRQHLTGHSRQLFRQSADAWADLDHSAVFIRMGQPRNLFHDSRLDNKVLTKILFCVQVIFR